MKKRLIAFGTMIALVVCMSMTAMASGVTADEQGVIDHFAAVQAKYENLLPAGTAEKNIAAGTAELNDKDLSADACKDLNGIIDKLDAALAAKNPQTKKELKSMRGELVSIVNGTSSDYFTISAGINDKGIGYVTITPKTTPSGSGDNTPAQENTAATVTIGQGIINQTGVDTTATVAVLGGVALISLLGVGAFVVSRNKKIAR